MNEIKKKMFVPTEKEKKDLMPILFVVLNLAALKNVFTIFNFFFD